MRFALWPNLTHALALARHADATGWDGVYIAEIAGADQKLLGGVAEFTPADDLSQGKPRASSGAECWRGTCDAHKPPQPFSVDASQILLTLSSCSSLIAIYDLLMSRILTEREIFIALAGQSGVRFGQHPTPRGPHAEIPHE